MASLKEKAQAYSAQLDVGRKLFNELERFQKADKIKTVLDEERVFCGARPTILDIGCSHGFILKRLSSQAQFCVGVDIDKFTVIQGAPNIGYVRTDAELLPFVSGSFDVIICNHVYEHTDKPEALFREIKRLLKPNGCCYFAGPNKYSLVEPHYRLPLLSWLPKKLADVYVRLMGKGDAYLANPYSHKNLIRLLAAFECKEYTKNMIDSPDAYCLTDLLPERSVKQTIAKLAYKYCRSLFPTYVFILRPKH